MEKLKAYGCLFLVMLGSFTLGIYVTSVKFGVQEIHPFRWCMTTAVLIMFIYLAIDKIKKLK